MQKTVLVATCGQGSAGATVLCSPTLGQLGRAIQGLGIYGDRTAIAAALLASENGDVSLWLGAADSNYWQPAMLLWPTTNMADEGEPANIVADKGGGDHVAGCQCYDCRG